LFDEASNLAERARHEDRRSPVSLAPRTSQYQWSDFRTAVGKQGVVQVYCDPLHSADVLERPVERRKRV
jgi:hypothetical protein